MGSISFASTIKAIRYLSPATTIEILTPDFLRKDGALEQVVEAKPDVFNHNLETVPGCTLLSALVLVLPFTQIT